MKKNIAFIFGGRSAEHEVSIRSLKNIFAALDRSRFNPLLFGISKSGNWFYLKNQEALKNLTSLSDAWGEEHALAMSLSLSKLGQPFRIEATQEALPVDLAFPIVHGSFGEDGSLQGFLKILNLPFVGCGVLSSAIGMDKEFMKKVLVSSGIKTAPYELLTKKRTLSFDELCAKLGSPFFIKPASSGSSVGVHKVKNAQNFAAQLADAFLYDHKVLAETFIEGREIECAVLGTNAEPRASLPGEVRVLHEFYSYEAKYLDDKGAEILIPAPLSETEKQSIQSLALKTFTELGCQGLTRVDFFLTSKGEAYVNEVNTLPGFTNISMYPQMWESSGLGYSPLISELIDLGFDQFNLDSSLKTDFL